MQVLKFGGSSVANAKNINEVIAIVQQSTKKNNNIVIILSALGGVTDALLEVATLASNTDISYKEKLHVLEHRHLTTVKELIPIEQQSSALSMVKKSFNNIEDTCNGVYLLKELSQRTKDSIISNGELLSSQIFAGKLKSLEIDSIWKDARELIITDSQFGSANVVSKNASCKTLIAFFTSLVAITAEIFFSEEPCAIARMFTPFFPSTLNILPLIPGWFFMLSPTSATIARSFSTISGSTFFISIS